MMLFTMSSLSSIVFLLGLYACISMADRPECPPKEDIYPCSCTEDDHLYVSCNARRSEDPSIEELQTILKSLPKETRMELRLYDYKFGIMPSKLFQGLDIKELVISNCYINGFEENAPAFYGLEDSLQNLYLITSLNDSTLHNSPVELGHLRKLQLLEISDHSKISHYYDYFDDPLKFDRWFESGPSSLNTLSLYRNRISDLGDYVFSELVNLKELDLEENHIGVLKRSMFPNPAQHLTKINLNYNQIEVLPEDIFHNMPALTEVYIRKNWVEELHQKVWEPIWEQIDVLHVGGDMNCERRVVDWLIDLKLPQDLIVHCGRPTEAEDKDLKEVLDEIRQ